MSKKTLSELCTEVFAAETKPIKYREMGILRGVDACVGNPKHELSMLSLDINPPYYWCPRCFDEGVFSIQQLDKGFITYWKIPIS